MTTTAATATAATVAAATPRGFSRIIGSGSYLPEKVLTNQDLMRIVDTSDEWITERTGIKKRHIASDDELTSDLAVKAAQRALAEAGIAAADLDLVVVGTVTGDMQMPSTAAYVMAKLGATRACGFDISAACSGFVHGLAVADKFISLRSARHALVIGVELLSRFLDWTDRSTCVIFGDAAGAQVLAYTDDPAHSVLSTHLFADGTRADILTIPGSGSRNPVREGYDFRKAFIYMEGREVFKVAVRNIVDASEVALRHNGLTAADVDWVVPHQANLRIVEGVQRRLGIPWEKWCLNIDRTGNTSSASIPVAFDEYKDRFKPGDVLLLSALGAGLNWGSALVRW
jgi:3-oxoacyl-[acyl-carrier-protein] synthase-3